MILPGRNLGKIAVAVVITAVVSSTSVPWAPPPIAEDAVKDTLWRPWSLPATKAAALMMLILALWYCVAPDSPAREPWTAGEAVAAVAALTGGLLRAWSMRVLGHFFTFQVTIREDHQLVQDGPYHWLMHPGYTGVAVGLPALLWYLRSTMALPLHFRSPRLWSVLGPGALCMLIARVLDEEAALAGHFAAAWEEYSAGRWRLVPLVW